MRRKKLSTLRLAIIFSLVTLCWVVLLARFAQIQIVQGARYEKLVENQCWGELKLSAKRGCILDCRDNLLAFDMASETFYTYTADNRYLRKLAKRVSRVTGDDGLVSRAMKRAGQFNLLARKASPEDAAAIKALDCDSIYSYREYTRVYPYGSLAVDAVGQIDIDHNGVSGLESSFDDQLSPDPGMAKFQRDGKGRVYRICETPLVRPHDGYELKLTIDIEYQQIVEEELRRAVDKWSAKQGIAVLIEVATGKILAVDCYSRSEEGEEGERVFKSKFVSDLFEPGSTFKIIAFAGMLEDKLFSLTDTIWAGMGKFQFNGRTLHDDKELGTITFRRAFELSSNIATGRFTQKLGGKRLFKYARLFGFGQPTGIELPGEQRGQLQKPRNWSDFWAAQTSIGHGLSVTALQLASSFAAIANGGVLMRPYVVEEVRTETGRLKRRFTPEKVRRVISEPVASVLLDLMGGVVDSGTAEVARIDEVMFGGKTGTAQKPNLESGGYYWDKYMASFGGFFPRQNPEIAGVVVIDEPKRVNYGGYTAAPAFAEMARRITMLERTRKSWVNGDYIQADAGSKVNGVGTHPAHTGKRANSSKSAHDYDGFQRWMLENRSISDMPDNPHIEDCRDQLALGQLPDMVGLASRDAVALLSGTECRIELEGNGRVAEQSPAAGMKIDDVTQIVLKCTVRGRDRHQSE